MQQSSLKQLTNGALLLALLGVLFLLDSALGTSIIFMVPFILPIPLILYTHQFGLVSGLTFIVLSSILAFLMTPIWVFVLVPIYSIIGLTIGLCFHTKQNDKATLVFTFFAVAIANYLMFFVFQALTGMDITQEMDFVIDFFQLTLLQWQINLTIILSLLVATLLEALVLLMLTQILCQTLKLSQISIVSWQQFHFTTLTNRLLVLGGLCFGLLYLKFGHLQWLYFLLCHYSVYVLKGTLTLSNLKVFKQRPMLNQAFFMINLPLAWVFQAGVGIVRLLFEK